MCEKEFNSEYADRGVRDNCPHCMSMWYERIGIDIPLFPFERRRLIFDIHTGNCVFKNHRREGYRMGADMSEFQDIIDQMTVSEQKKKAYQKKKLKVK